MENNIKIICSRFFGKNSYSDSVTVIFEAACHTVGFTRCCIGTVIGVGITEKLSVFEFVAYGNVGISDYGSIFIGR
jgi:hypothetical protein